MLKMKKLVSALLALALMVSIVPPVARAAGDPTISVTSGEVKAGESVTLTVSIEDNPGLAACMLYLYYDTAVFAVDPDSDVVCQGAFNSSGAVFVGSIAEAKANGGYVGDRNRDGVQVIWFNGSGQNTTRDGKMISVTFTCINSALSGDYTIGLGYSPENTINEEEKQVSVITESASITVTGGNGTKPEEPEEEPTEVPHFTDVSGHWAERFIVVAAKRGLILGYMGQYRPDDTMTRAEFVMILWRVNGSPKPAKAASFTELEQDWYRDAVAWAEANSVVNGVGNGRFEPEGEVTREQLATILHRMAGTPTGMEAMFTGVYDSSFSDSGEVGDWAKAALYWTVYNEIYCGEHSVAIGNTLAPTAPADRAQIAVMITRYLDKQ